MYRYKKKKIMAAALLTALMIMVTACAASVDLSGDYEGMEILYGMPTHLLLRDDGTALIDGLSGTWKANDKGQLRLSAEDNPSSYDWEQDGYWLILTGPDDEQNRYINTRQFTSEEGAEAIAGRWADDLGQLLLEIDADGTGLLIETETAAETSLRWQARDGILRLEYDDVEGITYEYLSFAFNGTQLRFCAYGDELGTDTDTIMSAPADQPIYEGQYRFMAVNTQESEMPGTLTMEPDGTLMLDDIPGEWTAYDNGITVFYISGEYIPMIIGDQAETLMTLETLTNSCVLWAREDTFAPDDALMQKLVGHWRDDDGNTLALDADGSISIDRQDLQMDGTAAVSPELIQITSGDTVRYIQYQWEEEGLRLAWETNALDDAENWPLFIIQNNE